MSRECPILVSTFHKFTKLAALCKKKWGIQHLVVSTLQPLLSRTCTANICQDTDLQSPSGLCMVDIFKFLNTRDHAGGRLFVQKMGGASDILGRAILESHKGWVKSPSLLRPSKRTLLRAFKKKSNYDENWAMAYIWMFVFAINFELPEMSKKWTSNFSGPNLPQLGLFHPFFEGKSNFRVISMIKIVILDQTKPISLIF